MDNKMMTVARVVVSLCLMLGASTPVCAMSVTIGPEGQVLTDTEEVT